MPFYEGCIKEVGLYVTQVIVLLCFHRISVYYEFVYIYCMAFHSRAILSSVVMNLPVRVSGNEVG